MANEYSSKYPLSIRKNKKSIEVLNIICKKHQYLPESFAQMLFFAVADIYCSANELDVSSESTLLSILEEW